MLSRAADNPTAFQQMIIPKPKKKFDKKTIQFLSLTQNHDPILKFSEKI
jgi:hypothetical protein